MRKLKIVLICLMLCSNSIAQTTNPPFWKDIQAFKKLDSVQTPKKNQILFIGSSSFTNWKDIQQYFPNHPIINRGFGGSTLSDVIRYAYDIILPYQPKQIVIYCGENDIASADSITGEMVAEKFKVLFNFIRSYYRNIPVLYISIKPSPSRWKMKDRMIDANKRIKKYLKKKKHTFFINVWDSMLGANGEPLPDIFLGDQLHMNAKGYTIWQKKIEPKLIN